MKKKHPAWTEPSPQWVPMAPGIRWFMRYPTKAMAAGVAIDTAKVMSATYADAEFMQAFGISDPATAVERVAGHAAVVAACLYARRCLIEWDGVCSPAKGRPADASDPAAIRTAIIESMAPGRPPAMVPLLAWIEGTKRSIANEASRLRTLAAAHWTGAAHDPDQSPQTIEGIACWDLILTKPDLWCEPAGSIPAGLDYPRALIAFEDLAPADVAAQNAADYGAAYECFRAIEAGRLEVRANG